MSTAEAPARESGADSPGSADLVRGLGLWQATAVVVSAIIGTGGVSGRCAHGPSGRLVILLGVPFYFYESARHPLAVTDSGSA